jgi:hypothetical protein
MEYLERLVVKSELHVGDVTQPGREPSGKRKTCTHVSTSSFSNANSASPTYIPVIPFTTDVGANAKDGVHASLLDLAEEPHDVVVSRKVVLKFVWRKQH